MNQEKYIGMDVHDATICAAVKNAEGKLMREEIKELEKMGPLPFYKIAMQPD